MKEIIIQYEESRTLEMLKSLAKYFDFRIVTKETTKKKAARLEDSDGYVRGDKTIDTSDLTEIFSKGNWDAKQLREEAWSRKR